MPAGPLARAHVGRTALLNFFHQAIPISKSKRLSSVRSMNASCSAANSSLRHPSWRAWEFTCLHISESELVLYPRQARESVYDLLPEAFSDWASLPSTPDAGAPEDDRELFDIAAKLPCRRRGERACHSSHQNLNPSKA